MPKVSVIIPAYNSERTIEETIRSVQNQNFSDWELIIINDGSQDKTLEIVQSIKDERIHIFSYENGGLPVARNRGIFHANGEYLTFLDADDLWTADKLELQVAALEKEPQAGATYSWTTLMWETETSVIFEKVNGTSFTGNIYPQLLLSNFIGSGSNIMLRKTVINSLGMFEPTLKSCEDWDFYLRVAANWHYVLVPKHQIIYRKTATSMTSKAHIMEAQGLLVLEKAYSSAPLELHYLKNQSFANLYRFSSELYLNYGKNISDLNLSWNKLLLSIKQYPKILFSLQTTKLIIKLLMRIILPANLISDITQSLKRIFVSRELRTELQKTKLS